MIFMWLVYKIMSNRHFNSNYGDDVPWDETALLARFIQLMRVLVSKVKFPNQQ